MFCVLRITILQTHDFDTLFSYIYCIDTLQKSLSCDFETDSLCIWQRENLASWSRIDGASVYMTTGLPGRDHSTGTQHGHFLYQSVASHASGLVSDTFL